jgi:tRNA pseudouridine38-40 synthase
VRNIRLDLGFDGSLFHGSQKQSDQRTVQGEVEKALKKLTGKKIKLSLAGRTDSGVHAFNQTGNFYTDFSIPDDRFVFALDGKVGKGIRINGSKRVKKSFDSRRSAKAREYIYFIYNGRNFPSMFWDKVGYVKRKMNLARIRSAAKEFVGRHDFYNFSARDKAQDKKSHIRKILSIEVGITAKDLIRLSGFDGQLVYIRIIADSFLYKMVRFIVGALVSAGQEKATNLEISKALSRKGGLKRTVVEPCGLYLSKVKY